MTPQPHWKRLTFDGVNDLYQHPIYGARTLENIAEMDAWTAAHHKKVAEQRAAAKNHRGHIDGVSHELYMRHERCIEQYGCGTFGD